MKRWKRQIFLIVVAICAFVVPAFAGSYLDRAFILVVESDREAQFLRRHLNDRELAKLLHGVASGRLETASRMVVPKEVALAHPHLLMILEHRERSTDAAVHGEAQEFLKHEQKAFEEERILRAILEQAGWSLPKE